MSIKAPLLGNNEYCINLANFLIENLNRKYRELREYKLRQEGVNLPLDAVVRSVYNYDKINISLSECPVLKVYRTADAYKPGRTTSVTNARIAYILSLPDTDRLPDLLTWISKQINILLLEYQRTNRHLQPRDDKVGYRCNYQILEINNLQAIYPFIVFDISFNDTNNGMGSC